MSEKKVALVTGASRGIGLAAAIALGKTYRVVGTATSQAGADRITAHFQEAGVEGFGAVLDVTCAAEQRDAFFAGLTEKMGAGISVLVNNAGVREDTLLMRMRDEQWQKVIDTNLTAIFAMSKGVVKDMMKGRWGRIINIGSIVGTQGNPGQTNYAAAKAGVVAFSKSLSMELASRGITVNVVSPGFIRTDMTDSMTDAQKQAILDRVPMKRMGECEEIAALVAFLASSDAGYITGENFHIDGGL